MPDQRPEFFEILSHDFRPIEPMSFGRLLIIEASPSTSTLATLSEAVEAPRQELLRRINTAPGGTETLVTLREHLLSLHSNRSNFEALDSISSIFSGPGSTAASCASNGSAGKLPLDPRKTDHYESVHEINGWPDLRRRLESDRRCFAFFHPALADEPIIFVEVALSKGLTGDLEPLLDLNAPVLPSERPIPPSFIRSTIACRACAVFLSEIF